MNQLRFIYILLTLCTSCVKDIPNSQHRKNAETNKLEKVNVFLDSCYVQADIDLERALHFANKASNYMQEYNITHNGKSIDIENSLWYCHCLIGNQDSAIYHAKKSIQFSKLKKDYLSEVTGYNELAYSFSVQGEKDSANFYIDKAILSLNPKKDTVKLASIYATKAGMLSDNGEFDKALILYFKALKIVEPLDSPDRNAELYNNIANNFHSWGDLNLALKYYEKSLILTEQMNLSGTKAIPLHNIGEIYKDKGEYKKAISYFNQCYEIGKKSKIQSVIAQNAAGLAECHIELQNFGKANTYINESLHLAEQYDELQILAKASYLQGILHYKRKEYKQAYQSTHAALIIANQLDQNKIRLKCLKIMSEIEAKRNNYKQASILHNKYSTVKDSLFTIQKATVISTIETLNEIEEKKSIIQELKVGATLQNEELDKASSYFVWITGFSIGFIIVSVSLTFHLLSRTKILNSLTSKTEEIERNTIKLQKSNQFREKVLSVISHDLKGAIGNMQVVFKQMVHHPEQFTGTFDKKMKQELYAVSENTFELLSNLLLWAKSDQSSEVKSDLINIQELLEANMKFYEYFAKNKNVNLKTECLKDLMVVADKNQLNVIFRNLLSNALKFTAANGTITIGAKEKDAKIKLFVKDTGLGISEDNIKKITNPEEYFTSYGTKNEKGTGLGLKLCIEFIEKHQSKLHIQSEEGKGTEFWFDLPKYEPITKTIQIKHI